jgi:HK97 family phage major capsid protein
MHTDLETKDAALKELGGKLEAKRKELAELLREAGPELDPSKITSREVRDGKELHEIVTALNAEIEELKDRYEQRRELLKVASEALESAPVETPQPAPLSLGEMFTRSAAYKGYKGGEGPVARLDVSIRDILRQATLMQTTAGWPPESTRIGRIAEYPLQPPRVADFLPVFPTTQAAVKYMEENAPTEAAAETAEAGAYPEAALALTEQTSTVRKVAVFIPVTDEQLEDEPQVRSYVDARLRLFLANRLDGQILGGNGTAPNLRGTANVTGVISQTQGTDTLLDAIYKAMRKVRDTGFAEPGVVFLRPADWETIRLDKTADGVYLYGSPADAGPERVWGVPVVQTTRMPAGVKAVTGDYASHAALFERRGIDVQLTNAHSTFFTEGKVAIRADMRVALVHFRPSAFAKVV